MSRKYESRKKYLQKIIDKRRSRIATSVKIPREIEQSLKELDEPSDTIEILDSDDDNCDKNADATTTKETPEVSNIFPVNNNTVS